MSQSDRLITLFDRSGTCEGGGLVAAAFPSGLPSSQLSPLSGLSWGESADSSTLTLGESADAGESSTFGGAALCAAGAGDGSGRNDT